MGKVNVKLKIWHGFGLLAEGIKKIWNNNYQENFFML